jgi:hypothetical protein
MTTVSDGQGLIDAITGFGQALQDYRSDPSPEITVTVHLITPKPSD